MERYMNWGVALFAILGAAVCSGVYFYHFGQGPLGDRAAFGAFGDFIGGVLNPFFSFLAIALLIRSLTLQSKELNASSEALRQSAKELSETKKVHENQGALQVRDNLRPQFQVRFDGASKRYDDLINKSVMFNDGSGTVPLILNSLYEQFCGCESKVLAMPEVLHKRVIAVGKSRKHDHVIAIKSEFKKALSSGLALIEFSDSVLMINEVEGTLLRFIDVMRVFGFINSEQVGVSRRKVSDTIEKRRKLEFPPLHEFEFYGVDGI